MSCKADEIRERVNRLREDMTGRGITCTLMMSTDPHASEYTGDHFKVTEYFSGCTSDNAVLVVSQEEARLWTDGRYFISAAGELDGTGIILMKSGEKDVPKITEYLGTFLGKGTVLGFDGNCVDAASGREFRKAAEIAGASVESGYVPAERIWADRPPLPCHPVWILNDDLTGMSCEKKLAAVREAVKQCGASCHMLSRLDDIMWLLNIRGGDIECNPVALSHLLIGPKTADLFIQESEVTEAFRQYAAENQIRIHAYEDVYSFLEQFAFDGPVLVSGRNVSDAMLHLLTEKGNVIDRRSPVERMKAVKNDTEIRNIRKTYLQDSAALIHFIFRMKKKIGKETMTEYTAAQEIDGLRREIPGFLDFSFPTISAYNANAAMAHYAVSEETAAAVKPQGFLLVDSGGQYMGGTTDVTRTIALGDLNGEMRRDFTLVAAANLRLLYTRFVKGTTGAQLDIIPRYVLYRYGMNYNHGTGHGVGYILNVHEGPQRIGPPSADGCDTPFEAGMVTSDEPGIYRENAYGIRTETIVLCVDDEETAFGSFLKFEPLTYVPIDRSALDLSYMEPSDIRMLNDYHAKVREKMMPYMADDEEREWLLEATAEVFAS